MAQPRHADEGRAAGSRFHPARREPSDLPVLFQPADPRPSHPMARGIAPEFFGLFDDNRTSGRMMAIANWNNDIGDCWEWSAEGLYGDAPTADAYRLGVDYLVYAMTH